MNMVTNSYTMVGCTGTVQGTVPFGNLMVHGRSAPTVAAINAEGIPATAVLSARIRTAGSYTPFIMRLLGGAVVAVAGEEAPNAAKPVAHDDDHAEEVGHLHDRHLVVANHCIDEQECADQPARRR